MEGHDSVLTGRVVVVLGAGASRGANFGFQPLCQPPLNADFFTQLQRIVGKHGGLVRRVVKDVVSLFDANFHLTLEEYFTQLEFALATAVDLRLSTQVQALTGRRDRLMAALSAVLEHSTRDAITRSAGGRGCEYHRLLVRSLEVPASIISFNYDCIIDDALRLEGDGKWSSRWGYRFPSAYRIDPGGEAFWNASSPASSAADTITLLKLHGSLHWQIPSDPSQPIVLKRRLHSQNGTPRFTIVPPEWNKSVREQPVFKELWEAAFNAVSGAQVLILVGFSFAQTDLHAESRFRLALEQAPLSTVIIANPSPTDRSRTRTILASVLRRTGAVVRQYDGLRELAAAWPGCAT